MDQAAACTHSAERAVQITAVIRRALQALGQDPILVGGAAVEFYTQGGYSTADIDLVAPGGPAVAQTLSELGFKRMGKDFVDSKRKIYLEFPSAQLKPEEQSVALQVHQEWIRIISPEDLIVDRLCAFKFWGSAIDGINALMLLEGESLDRSRLEARAAQEEVLDALQMVEQVQQQSIRRKLSRQATTQLLIKKLELLRPSI